MLLSTSAQNVQVGPVSKDRELSHPGLLTPSDFFTLLVIYKSYDGCTILYYLPPSPIIFLTLSLLILLYCFPPAMVDSLVFLKHTRPASAFQPFIGFSSSRNCLAPPQILLTHLLTSFKTLLRCHLLNKPTLATFLKIVICLHFTLAFLISQSPLPCAI